MTDLDLINLIELLDRANDKGIRVSFDEVQDELMILMHQHGEPDQLLLQDLKLHKQALKEYLSKSRQHALIKDAARQIAVINRNDMERLPLSFSQERLWFIDRLQGTLHYHIPLVLHLGTGVDVQALEFAFNAIITRHEILRTVIKDEDGKAYQVIMDAACWRMNYIHWEQQPAALQAYIEQLVTAPFDLAADFMIKAWLVKTPGGQFTLALVMHHIASDGWSVQILMKELMELYISRREGRQPALRPLPVQYADYALWQRRYLSEKIMAEKLLYWKVQLKDVEPLELPADHARQPEQSIKGRAVGRSTGSGLMKNLHTLGARQGTTLFMTLLAAFKVLLYRYSGQTDICVGSPVAGRQQQELEGLIGFFVNTLALRSNVNGHTPFTAFLDEVKQTTLGAYENQEVPFDKIVEALAIERDVRRHPVFQVLFSIQHRPSGAGKESEELQLMPEKLTQHFSQYDISLDIVEANDGLHMVLTYCSDLFEQHTMIRMLDHYEQLLNAIIKDPEQPIAQMQMMSNEEMQLVKSGFNSSAAEYRRGATFIELFEEQAERTPALTAVIDNRDALSYRQLHERSGLLASYLRTRGVKEGTLVPVCIERSTGMLVALLAVLKAGGAYVPVDGEYPIERIAFMLQDTAATLVLTTTRYRNRFTEKMAAEIICLDEWDHTAAPPAKPADSPVLSASRLAYVIYTSGSTGKPKGVMIAHDALLNFLTSMSRLLQMNERHTMLAVTTCSFDISGLELYVPLLSGSKVYITGNDDVKDGHKLQALLSIAAATHMQATPATWQLLLESGWQNREQITILTGGEAVPEKLKDELVSLTGRCVWNCYGPTETTIWSTVKQLNANEKVNIGAPIANTQVYILNDEQLCPIGIPGELCIGGNGLAKGYLNNPALTDEKFVKNFFGSGKLYRTGDLAKWLPNGNIAYLGRLDNQVKIRGYRIETGEVETVLNQAPGVKQAAVVAVKDNAGSNRLVAYLQVEAAYEQHTVYTWLRTHLPEYMLPAVLLTIEQLPLTPNGKVNRKKLAGMKLEAPQGRTFVAPRNETEVKLAEIWSALLDVDTIGVHDNFFEVGGHSLMAMRVVAAVRKQFNIELNVRDLFLHPTIAALALIVKEFPGGAALPSVVHHAGRNEFPLSFSQERLWFINRLQGSVQYHLPYFLKLQGELDIHALEAAFKAVLARHAVLRSVISETDGMLCQQIKEMTHWQLETILPVQAGGGQKMANDGIARFVNRPFDLSADCMLRAALFMVTANEYVLVVVLHHIAADGWSMAVFITEMMELYNSIREMRPPVVQPLPVQYADYALWQREALAGTVLEAGLQYWRQQLQELEPFELLTDYQRPPDTSTLGAVESRLLEQELANALISLSRQAGATLFMTMLAAFKLLLYRYSGQKDIAVGSPTAGRQLQEVEGLIGCFVNNLVLRSHIHDDLSFMELLEQVKETTLGAYEHQHIPFEKVVEALGVQRDISRHPLFQIMFSLMNTPAATTQETTGLNLNGYDGGIVHAKYDLNIEISTVGDGLSVVMTYGSELFTPATIRQLLSHYRQLLYSIVTNPFVSIGKLALLQEEEERQLLHGFNATAAKVEPATIIDLFAKQAALNPDAIAVVYENQSLSYRQLDERSNQLAHYLRHKGVKEETLVPICIDRSLNMIIGLLGILKAGGAYVPVDPAYPTGRIAYLLSDTAATIAVSIQACEDRFEHTGIQTLVCLDSHSAQIEACAPTPPSTKLKPGNLSYVIYTSGSTGRPKGVMNEHGGVVNRLRWTQHCFALNATDAVLQKTTFCFDVSVWELFWPLISGAKLVFATPDGQKDPQYIKDIIRAQQITTIHFVPSMLSVFLESVEAGEALPLQRVLCSGEALQLSHVREFRRKLGNTGLHNLYGPTEAAIEVSYWEVPLQVNDLHVIPIGRPVWNTQLYILDAAQRLLPPAAAGELYIGGVQVARGYLNRQELTEERFILNPFGAGCLYRTGDLARWLPDGTIEYLGRIDDQVKIRGYRIEPGEVENVLQGAPGIKQAAVAVAGSSEEDKRLVGFIVTEESYVKETVLTYLYNTLPAYMIPAQLIPVSAIPFTASGKVNRKQLPKPEGANATGKVYVPPGNELEAGLIEIWKGLLKTDHIGINDNFFELGGHSLMAFRLVLAITKKWDITIPLKAIFQLPDIKSLAATVSALLHLNNDVAIIEDEEEITL